MRIPWSACSCEHADSNEFDVATIVDYLAKPPGKTWGSSWRHPTRTSSTIISLTWAQLLGEELCLDSLTHRAQLLSLPSPGDVLQPQPPGKSPRDHYWDPRAGAWYDYRGQKRVLRETDSAPIPRTHANRNRLACCVVEHVAHVLLVACQEQL